MNTQPHTISLSDTERKAVAAYMGNRGMATRKQVKEMAATLWEVFLEQAIKRAARIEKLKSQPPAARKSRAKPKPKPKSRAKPKSRRRSR